MPRKTPGHFIFYGVLDNETFWCNPNNPGGGKGVLVRDSPKREHPPFEKIDILIHPNPGARWRLRSIGIPVLYLVRCAGVCAKIDMYIWVRLAM